MSSLPDFPLSALTTNTNITTSEGKAQRELNNFPKGNTIGTLNTIRIIRTNWEVGKNIVIPASSDLIS
jgi:hypothetical protein